MAGADPNKQHTIISLSKKDIIDYYGVRYGKSPRIDELVDSINKLTEKQMLALVSKMRHNYIDQMMYYDLESNLSLIA